MEPQVWARRRKQFTSLARWRDWPQLWWQLLELPLPRAVDAARHLDLRRWRPPGDADTELAELLVTADRRRLDRVVSKARTSWSLRRSTSPVSPVAFAHREPVAALTLSGRALTTSEIVTVDRNGIRTRLYDGPGEHGSLCCLDAGTVVAVREFGAGSRGDAEVVRYDPDGETVLATGNGLLDAALAGTANGFVLGVKLSSTALALADGGQEELDLAEHGLRSSHLLAVDRTGTTVAFADRDRVLITDSRLQPLELIDAEHVHRGGGIRTLAFTSDALLTAGYDGGLHRWARVGDRYRGVQTPLAGASDPVFSLHPVPAWNLVVAESGNRNAYRAEPGLERVEAPAFVGGGVESVGRFAAAAHGALAVHEGHLFPDGAGDPTSVGTTVVRDLRHPLNALAVPLAAVGPVHDHGYDLAADEREVLDLLRHVARLGPLLGDG